MKFVQIIIGPSKIGSYNILLSKDGVKNPEQEIPVPDEITFSFLKKLLEEAFVKEPMFKLEHVVEEQESLIIQVPQLNREQVKEKIEGFITDGIAHVTGTW